MPQELRDRPQWVVWKYVDRPDRPKPTKEPRRADNPNRKASTTNPKTWATFEQAVAALEAGDPDGIGFVFTQEDPYVGVDLDDGLPDTDRAAITLALDSYTETSPSGDAEHVIVRASLNGHGRNRKGPFEVYEDGRYFTVTGAHVKGTPTTIEARQAQLDEVIEHYLPQPKKTTTTTIDPTPVDLNDQQLLDVAFAASNGADFRDLWEGRWEQHQSSQSEADLDLCGRLAFYTGRDPARIDRMFRASKLIRDKWDSHREDSTYGAMTIEKAVAGCTQTYTPPAPRDAEKHDQQSSRPARDATGTQTVSRPSEKPENRDRVPRPDVVGTRDGTRSLSDGDDDVNLHLITVTEFVNVDEPGAAPLIGDADNVLIPEGGDVMFFGDGGAGKTTMMIDQAMHLAAGVPWLGIPIPRAVRVAIIENEGPRPLFRAKLRRKVRAWAGSPIGDRLLLLEEPWAKTSLDVEQIRGALAARIAVHKLDVVMIGPVTRSGMNEAGTLQHVRDYTNLLADVRTLSGRRVTFMLAHHENRGGQVSGAWEGAVDTLFHVQAQGHGQTRLFIQKARWSADHHKQKMQLAWTEGEGFEVIEDEERDDNTIADEILAYVLEHGGTGWNKVDQAVEGKGDRLRSIRDSLLDGARLVNTGTPARMKLWHADDPARPYIQDGLT